MSQDGEHFQHLPKYLAAPVQFFSHHLLIWLTNYQVKTHRQLPQQQHLIAAYPHSQHADSILLPPSRLAFIAAQDTFFKSNLARWILATVIDTLPLNRTLKPKTLLKKQIENMTNYLSEHPQKHLLVYPQGTRAGAVEDINALDLSVVAAHLAIQLGLPILPIYIQYPADHQPNKHKPDISKEVKWQQLRRPPKRVVNVYLGESINTEKSDGNFGAGDSTNTDRELRKQLTTQLISAFQAIARTHTTETNE